MNARVSLALLALATTAAEAQEAAPTTYEVTSAAIAPGGDEVRLVTSFGGTVGATLRIGKGEAKTLAKADSVGAVEVAHGKVVVALATMDTKPFRVVAGDKSYEIARPNKTASMPFAMGMTSTPTGFTVFFQEVEVNNPSEAHTYMLLLDKDGKPDGAAKEVAVPWWLADAQWNAGGYHLALYYAGEMRGSRLSMVSLTEAGVPQQHPDWASQPGQLSDMHLVADGKKILAYYRGGVGDKLYVTDVTTIGQWGANAQPAKDLGALDATASIAINDKGQPVRVKALAPAKVEKVVEKKKVEKPKKK